MAKDYSKYSNEELIKHIEELEKQLKSDKYGLYWDKEIEEDEQVKNCKTSIPFLEIDREKTIILNNGLNNLLIEGDNFPALTALSFIMKDGIDAIYIDPPYNMGSGDFIYNDKYVDKEDGYRHSKWLNFMSPRLKLAKDLLNNDGFIFISIDDNELYNLKLLCDSIFHEKNFVASCFVLDNLKGKANDNFITSVGSRLLVYAKDKDKCSLVGFNNLENVFGQKIEDKFKFVDELGFYNEVTFKKTGQSKTRYDRPFMFYPILEKHGVLYSIEKEEFDKLYDVTTKEFDDNFLMSLKKKYREYNFVLPTDSNGEYLRWTSGFNTYCKKMNGDIIWHNGIKQKTRPDAIEMLLEYATGTPKSFMYKTAYSTGTEDCKKVIGDGKFDFPKPITLMKDIFKLLPNKNAVILDFFAGSGTTGQAVLELNQEDGGNRKVILCTNNENNICEEITYERLRTIVTGKRKNGTKYDPCIPSNLIYLKTNFIKDCTNSDQAKYCLVEKVDGLLCIAENLFEKVSRNDFSAHYTNLKKDRHLNIYFDYYNKDKFNKFKSDVLSQKGEKVVYVFSLDNNVDETLFGDIKDIQVKPIPYKIYEIYKEIVEDIKRG